MGGSLVTGVHMTNYVPGTEGKREWLFPFHPFPPTSSPMTDQQLCHGKHHTDVQIGSNMHITIKARQEILVENFHISNNPALQNLSSQSVHPQFSTMAPERKKLECSNQKITT